MGKHRVPRTSAHSLKISDIHSLIPRSQLRPSTVNALQHAIRKNRKFYYWRQAVYKTYNYRCEKCGERRKKIESRHDRLSAHHKYPLIKRIKVFISLYKEFNIDMVEDYKDFWRVEDGEAMCKRCHWTTFKK